jgi:YD repeat-containing protein
MVQKIVFSYNDLGQLLQTQVELPDGSKYISNKYSYNAKGQLIEEQWKSDANKDYSRSTFTYDDNGVVKTVDSFYANFKRQMLSVYVYELY